MKNQKKLWVIVPVVMLSALVYTSHANGAISKASQKTATTKCSSAHCNCTDCDCGSSCTCVMCD